VDERLRQYLVEGERAGMRYALGLPRLAPVGLAGSALGHRTGSSLEFKDYRDYQPGDDLRHIDWNAFARSDQLSIKLFREEVHPHLDVVFDASRSMDLEDSAKGRATLALAAFFAAAAANAGYSHAAWLLGPGYRPVANGQASPSLWEGIDFAHRGPPEGEPGAAASGAPAWRPRGLRVLLSDLLWLGEPLATLRPLAERAAVVVVVQVLAAADVDPPAAGNLRLVDSETGETRDLRVDDGVVRRYREALARHQQNWSRACRQVGAVFTTAVAEVLLRDWKLGDLVAAEVLRVK
jgi:uncharacterized protein (DUF58 family)